MFNLVNVSNVPVNFADFGMSPISGVDASKMNACKHVVIVVADTSEDTLALLNKRRGFQFYHPEFNAYCLMLSRKEVWSLQATIDYIVDIQQSKQLSRYCQREAVAYTHELVNLYNQLNSMCHHLLPDFGSDELISYLEDAIRGTSQVDYRSAGKLMHYEKDHFYKFEKMSDFLNPDEVYTDKDNRIVWSTTKDRLGTHYIDCHLEDLLREYMSIVYLQYNDVNYDFCPEEHIDATSSEELMGDVITAVMRGYILRMDSLLNPLTDDEKIELATMINMHRDIFNKVCESMGIEFQMR